MISNKKWQQLLALAKTREKLPNDATEEEKEDVYFLLLHS